MGEGTFHGELLIVIIKLDYFLQYLKGACASHSETYGADFRES